MLTIAYYTPGPYAGEAVRLRRSLDAVGMPHEIVEVPSAGDWNENVALKAHVIRRARDRHGGGLLYIDVDAVVHADCTPYFEALEQTADFAAHWFQGRGPGGVEQGNDLEHMCSGTMFFNDTPAARELLESWIQQNHRTIAGGDRTGRGQRNLAWIVQLFEAIDRDGVGREGDVPLRVHRLPGRYCYVFYRPDGYPPDEPMIIEHTNASRENRDHSAGTVDPLRRRRLAELDGTPPAPAIDLAASIRSPRIVTHKRSHAT